MMTLPRKIALVNFANGKYRAQQKDCTDTAYKYGKADIVFEYNEYSLPKEFYLDNKDIMSYVRGFGLWLWKPYVILMAMQKLKHGDVLFYADAGAGFIAPLNNLIPTLLQAKDMMLFFSLPLREVEWTKSETMQWMDYHPSLDSLQVTGNIMAFVVSEKSRNFVSKWYSLCREERLLSPAVFDPSIPAHPWYIEHREDQSILSILVHQQGYTLYRDPSNQGHFYYSYWYAGKHRIMPHYADSPYATIMLNVRRRSFDECYRDYKRQMSLHRWGMYNFYTFRLWMAVKAILRPIKHLIFGRPMDLKSKYLEKGKNVPSSI